MKKSTLSIAMLAILATACNKQTPDHFNSTSSSATPAAHIAAKGKNPANGKTFYGWKADCAAPATNCFELPPIVITPKRLDMLVQAENGGPGTVGSVFNDQEFADICESLGDDITARLQSGSYYIAQSNNSDNYITYVAGTTAPLTESNFEFAFQLPK